MLNFRNSRIALVALSGLLMVGTTGAALAQAPQGGGRRGGVTIEQLTDRLKLTPDQVRRLNRFWPTSRRRWPPSVATAASARMTVCPR